MTTRIFAWDRYKRIVIPTYVREEDIYSSEALARPWAIPKPEYAWIVMKALLLLKMELKDKPWMCGAETLQIDIKYIQKMIDSTEVK
jgi:hypothetical protein